MSNFSHIVIEESQINDKNEYLVIEPNLIMHLIVIKVWNKLKNEKAQQLLTIKRFYIDIIVIILRRRHDLVIEDEIN